MNDLPIVIRPMVETDYGYVMTSWSREFHKTEVITFMSNDLYIPWQTARINWCIANTLVLVAHLEDSPDDIIGYICAKKLDNNLLIHWMNVKGIFRRFGVAKELLAQYDFDKIICTHYFKLFSELKDKYSLIYNPLLVPANG